MKYAAVLLLLCVLPLNAQDYVLVSGAAGTPSFDTACKIWRLSAGSTALELMLDLGAEISVMPSEQYPENSKHRTVAMEVPGFYAIRAFPDEQTLVVWSEVEEGIGAVFCFDVRQLPDYKRAHPRGDLNVTSHGMIHVLTKIGKRPGCYQVDTRYQTSSTQEAYDETVPWEGVHWYRSPAQGRGVQLDASGQGIPNSFYGIRSEGAERLQIPTQVFCHFLGTFSSLRGIPINTARVIVVNGGILPQSMTKSAAPGICGVINHLPPSILSLRPMGSG